MGAVAIVDHQRVERHSGAENCEEPDDDRTRSLLPPDRHQGDQEEEDHGEVRGIGNLFGAPGPEPAESLVSQQRGHEPEPACFTEGLCQEVPIEKDDRQEPPEGLTMFPPTREEIAPEP